MSSPLRKRRKFSARAAARRRTAPCAFASASPMSIPSRPSFCSRASSRRRATSRPISMSISSMSGAKRSFSIFIGAIREVGQALGLTPDVTTALAKTIWGYGSEMPDQYVREAGFDPNNEKIRQAVDLTNELIGFPRHLSQHVGGFVLTRKRLDETVPIGNAAMEDRTFIEWDKDDIDTLGLMKVDVLALGMLTCLRRGLKFLNDNYAHKYRKPFRSLADLPD